MLKTFRVTNFINFKEEIAFHFDGVKDYGFNADKLIKRGLVNKALVYGRNASGKTNLALAIMEITNHLVEGRMPSSFYRHMVNAASHEEGALFEYVFLDSGGKEIRYRYAKDCNHHLLYEEVYHEEELIYAYDYREKKLKEMKIEEARSLDFRNDIGTSSGVKLLSKMGLEDAKPFKFIVDFVEGMHCSLGVPTLNEDDFLAFLGDTKRKEGFSSFLKKLGLHDELMKNDASSQSLSLSSGTISLLNLYRLLTKAITFLYIDDFDAFYHFSLAEKILKEINGMDYFQSVLSTHNSYLLSNDFMRPDTYYFLKDNHLVQMAEATPKVIRRGNNLEKMYRAGEFGEV